MSQAGAYIPSLGFSPNKFVLHNAGSEPRTFRWASLQFTIPEVDVVGPEPALDADGDPIPGTLVLKDGYSVDRDGAMPPPGSPPNWMAFEAIRNVLGVDPNTKQATGVMAKAGVSFLPNAPTKEVVAVVREDGRRRYAESQVEWAQYVVSAYESRVAAARATGAQAAPPGEDYVRAVQILKNWKDRIVVVPAEAVVDDEQIEFEVFAKAKAMEMATKAAAGKEIDRAALAEELLKDPKVRAHLGRKYRIRKRGYPDVPSPEQEG